MSSGSGVTTECEFDESTWSKQKGAKLFLYNKGVCSGCHFTEMYFVDHMNSTPADDRLQSASTARLQSRNDESTKRELIGNDFEDRLTVSAVLQAKMSS